MSNGWILHSATARLGAHPLEAPDMGLLTEWQHSK